jgi:hypothetical protein
VAPAGTSCGDDGPRAYQRAGADPHPAEDHRPRADARPLLNDGPDQGPVLSLEISAVRRRARPLVVDEYHAVPYEHGVTDRYAVADEGVWLWILQRAPTFAPR